MATTRSAVPAGQFVIGTVAPYGGRIDAAAIEARGWLYCDGRELDRRDYPDLFAVIGTLHGSGDGTTTFNLPDYRGFFLRGVDDGTGRDPEAKSRKPAAGGGMPGDNCGSVQGYATARPVSAPFTMTIDGNHDHEVWHIPDDNSLYAIAGGHLSIWNGGTPQTGSNGRHDHTIVDGDAETRPLNAYVNLVIRYRA
jgi:hypothetical protein